MKVLGESGTGEIVEAIKNMRLPGTVSDRINDVLEPNKIYAFTAYSMYAGNKFTIGQINNNPNGKAIVLFYAISETRGFPIQIIGNAYVNTPATTYQFKGFTIDELLSSMKTLPETYEEITSVDL